MNQANGQRAPIIGSQPKFSVQTLATPNASPGIVSVPTPAGLQTFVLGGLTKLEEGALRLLAACPEADAQQIVARVAEVLNVCGDYERVAPESPPEDEGDEKPSPIVQP